MEFAVSAYCNIVLLLLLLWLSIVLAITCEFVQVWEANGDLKVWEFIRVFEIMGSTAYNLFLGVTWNWLLLVPNLLMIISDLT